MPERIFILLLLFFSRLISAQVITGRITDERNEGLPGISVKVLAPDSQLVTGTATDIEGKFSVKAAAEKQYTLIFSGISYATVFRTIFLKEDSLDLGRITMRENAKQLKEVEVRTLQLRGEQKGDTTSFNAGAYKTNPDANAEDLVKKMPGITSDNSGIKVNGENVQKILVDGKPFFGDDPNAALKNLPAEIIDKVEVFDRMSDQSQFTGFNDGEQQKTINIVTKKGRNTGQFGRIYGGAGADENANLRYGTGAALNQFSAKRKITLLLLSNNINQQNFSAADLSGVTQNNQQGGRGGQGGGRQGGNPILTSAPQNGITATNSAGLNYTDQWTKKVNVSGSYFFNNSGNINTSDILRNYFTDNRLIYRQLTEESSNNTNHRMNFRLELSPDSFNKVTWIPAITVQDHNLRSALSGSNALPEGLRLSETNTQTNNSNLAYELSNSLLVQHKFTKPGRTISVNGKHELNERNNQGRFNSDNIYADSSVTATDQEFRNYTNSKRYSANLSYTEPLSKNSQVQISYLPSYTEAKSDRATRDLDHADNAYDIFNPSLSNKYDNTYRTQRAGAAYKYRKEKLNATIGADIQEARLSGRQQFPVENKIQQSFTNILPNAQLNYRQSKTRNLRINYRSSTNIPNVTQLQEVPDISNPLQIRTGNSALKQTFEHNLFFRYGGFNPVSARNFMVFMNFSAISNNISNATYILRRDTLLGSYPATAGAQLTKPVNLDGYKGARAFLVYGFPFTALKSNVNVNGGVTYARAPALIDDKLNYSNSTAMNAGAFIGSNIQDVDFSIGYTANYTTVRNTARKNSDNDFFTHIATAKINWLLKQRLVLSGDASHNVYSGLSQSFNQQYFLLNGAVAYKFLENKSLELRLSVYDILNQNRSISRTVTGAYTEDNLTLVLRRYALLTLTYTLRNFSGESGKKDQP